MREAIVTTPRRAIVGVRGRRRIAVALDGKKLTIRFSDHLLRFILPPADPKANVAGQ